MLCFLALSISYQLYPVDLLSLGSGLVVYANCVAGKVHALQIVDGKFNSISLDLDVVLLIFAQSRVVLLTL